MPCPWRCGDDIAFSDLQGYLGNADMETLSKHNDAQDCIESRKMFYCLDSKCGTEAVNELDDMKVVCPKCEVKQCSLCKRPWDDFHQGVSCDDYTRVIGDQVNDRLLTDLLKSSGWKACPHCGHVVEKTEGCNHMTCLCKLEFCYLCGGVWLIRRGLRACACVSDA
jgi:DNA-directed RNA polymerase subunit RPC12/RpoP